MNFINNISKTFLYTRLFYYTLIFFTYILFDRFDSSNLLIDVKPEKGVNRLLAHFLKNFYSYDAVHFISVAKNGYTNDKSFAFFPFFPTILAFSSKLFQSIFGFKNEEYAYILTGLIINNILCLTNGILLQK